MGLNQIDAILPAGGTLTAEDGTKRYKASLPIGETTLLDIVIQALKASGQVRRIVLIGPEEVTRGHSADFILEPGESGPDNIYRGLETLLQQPEPPENVLIATTDLPFLTPQSVRDFLAIVDSTKDLNLPIVRAEPFEKAFPGAHATFVKIKEGRFTLGGLFYLNAKAMLATRPHIEAVFAARKSKLQMAKLFGFKILLKFLTGRLQLTETEQTAERILGCTARTLPNSPVELAYDVDDLDEYNYAVRHNSKVN